MVRALLILITITFFGFSSLSLANLGEEIKDFSGIMKNRGIEKYYSIRSFNNLVKYYDRQIKKRVHKPEKYKDSLKFLRFGKSLLESHLTGDPKKRNVVGAFVIGKRILYAVKAEEQGRRKTGIKDVVKTPFALLTQFQTTLKYVPERFREKKIGKTAARAEARYLIRDEKDEHYISKDELADLSVNEIAKLDIPEFHPVWHTKSFMAQNLDSWERIENWANTQAEKHILKKKKITTSYNLKKAHKILFFKGIKTTATSPKVKTKDLFGMKWKLKWGNEVQVEPVSNRLYVALGGKFADLTYHGGHGKNALVLVLSKEDRGCKKIATLKNLKKCLMESKYEFFLDPYVLDNGIISKENIASILKTSSYPYNEAGQDEEDLIGREYVVFKQSMVEFSGSGMMVRGGASASSDLSFHKDRAGRGLFIFNAWIFNTDAKDDNSKALLLKNFLGQDEYFVETQHDMGASIGKLGNAGYINGLKTGSDFILLKRPDRRRGRQHHELFVNQLTLYRPKAWRKVTMSDAIWMAEKIAKLPKYKIREIVKASKWPTFVQEALVYKLIARRNRIATVFNLEHFVDDMNYKAPTIKVDLSSTEKRKELLKEHVPFMDAEELSKEFYRFLRDRVKRKLKTEYLLKNGRIQSCGSSYLIDFLEQTSFPAGLSRRIKRFKDNRPLDICHELVDNDIDLN